MELSAEQVFAPRVCKLSALSLARPPPQLAAALALAAATCMELEVSLHLALGRLALEHHLQ